MDRLHAALSRSAAVEQIAEILHDVNRGDSVLTWDDLPCGSKEDYRARGRHALRSTFDYAVQLGIEQMAIALAGVDGYAWSEVTPASVARYRHRARAAWKAMEFHLAETAYPEDQERRLAEEAQFPRGQTLGQWTDRTRRARVIEMFDVDWRDFTKERR